jgi:hypothetical protein
VAAHAAAEIELGRARTEARLIKQEINRGRQMTHGALLQRLPGRGRLVASFFKHNSLGVTPAPTPSPPAS